MLLTFNHEEMADILSEWFFAKDPSTIPTLFHNDPVPSLTNCFNLLGKQSSQKCSQK